MMRLSARGARDLRDGLLFLLPSAFLFAVFVFYPLARTFYLSLFITSPTGRLVTFAGLDQYLELLTSKTFQSSLLATSLFVLYAVPVGIAIALVLATLANRRLRGINVFRTLMTSTIALSAAVGSLIWLMLLNPNLGLLNYLLSLAGIRGPNWLQEQGTAVLAVSMTTIWLTLGFRIIVLLAGLQGVPEELYEAAKIDGASPFAMFRRITVPLLSPQLFFLLGVHPIGAFQGLPPV